MSCKEILSSVCTMTKGALAQRHWCMDGFSKLGHRLIALIKAIPVLGRLVALIEITVMKYLFSSSEVNPSSQVPQLEFNVQTTLTQSQILMLKILARTAESELPEYNDSLFEVISIDVGRYLVTREKKRIGPPSLGGNPIDLLPLQGPLQKENPGGVLEEEGLKVRTFSLELLSSLEDAIKGAPPNRASKLKESKEVVKYFLQNGALEKQAGFSDFLKLIEKLRDQVPESASLLRRFFDLVQSQKYIPQRKKLSHWHKIKVAIQLGLFKGIDQTLDRIEAIGLHAIPAIPKCQRIVNLYPMIDAINLVESHHREAGRWLMTRMRVFTFRELCHSIQQSCLQLHSPILSWDRYCLLIINGKSQEWMADLAIRYLPKDKMPEQVLSMHHNEGGRDIFQHLKESGFDHFILFDDGAYSGQQINTYLFDLYSCLLTSHTQFERKKTIYLVFGFFPKDRDLQKEIKELGLEKYNVHVRVLTNCRIESCNTLMEKEELPESIRDQIRDLAGSETKPLIATEWKKPDFMSTPMFVTEGWTSQWGRASYALQMDGEGPVADVVPPYRRYQLEP